MEALGALHAIHYIDRLLDYFQDFESVDVEARASDEVRRLSTTALLASLHVDTRRGAMFAVHATAVLLLIAMITDVPVLWQSARYALGVSILFISSYWQRNAVAVRNMGTLMFGVVLLEAGILVWESATVWCTLPRGSLRHHVHTNLLVYCTKLFPSICFAKLMWACADLWQAEDRARLEGGGEEEQKGEKVEKEKTTVELYSRTSIIIGWIGTRDAGILAVHVLLITFAVGWLRSSVDFAWYMHLASTMFTVFFWQNNARAMNIYSKMLTVYVTLLITMLVVDVFFLHPWDWTWNGLINCIVNDSLLAVFAYVIRCCGRLFEAEQREKEEKEQGKVTDEVEQEEKEPEKEEHEHDHNNNVLVVK